MAKNYLKITKSTFLGKTLCVGGAGGRGGGGGHGSGKPVFGAVGGSPRSLPLGETLGDVLY